MNFRFLIKELLSLTNCAEMDESTFSRMKDLVCFLSEKRQQHIIPKDEHQYLDFVLYAAATRMRTFGYNRQNSFSIDDFSGDAPLSFKDLSIANYYRTTSGAVLDRLQKEVLDKFEAYNHRLFLSAPTSFGKTFLLKEILYQNQNRYNNIAIVLPTVALLMEVSGDLAAFFKNQKMDYSIFNSVYRDLEIADRNVFILTPERVLRLLALKEDLRIDFVFYDEIYKVDEDIAVKTDDDAESTIEVGNLGNNSKNKIKETDNHRASAFRLALYLLMEQQPECYIAGPFIHMDALKSGFRRFLEKYHVGVMEAHYEPTLKNKIDFHGKTFKIKSPIESESKNIHTQAVTKAEKMAFTVKELGISKENPAIVYCLFPGYTETYAREYCNGKEENKDSRIELFIEHVKKNFNCRFGSDQKSSTDNWDFLYALKHGIGIHNGKFPKYFQREIMDLFNQKKMPMLFCTSTIVEGVNTNAKTIIVYNNPSGENPSGKRFLLLNINGRAGRYLKHFIGNIVYLEKKCLDIENGDDINLDFKLFSYDTLLGNLDLENVADADLSEANLKAKRTIALDRNLLPDDVFFQNRLIERQEQEQILKEICQNIYRFYGIQNATVSTFFDRGYFDAILEIWAKAGEIRETQIAGIKYFAKNYADNGYLGVLDYRFRQYSGEETREYVNKTYRNVFKDVKDTVEYQLPRILSLFETLINRAFVLKGKRLSNPVDLSRIIRYFEIGAKTLLGADMIEKGVPVITVRKMERHQFIGETVDAQKREFYAIQHLFSFDEYEKMLINRYMNS